MCVCVCAHTMPIFARLLNN